MLNFISKLFGNKSERDVKGLWPLADKVKVEYAKLDGISHDELREKTAGFKQRIKRSACRNR